MSGPLSPRELAGVARVLASAGVDLSGELRAEAISAGRSNLTVRLHDAKAQWVLRTPPRTGRTPSAHDVAREFRVTRALVSQGIPVPPPVVLYEDEDLLGGPFAVAEFVDGRTIQTRADLSGLPTDDLNAACADLIRVLAALHAVDPIAAGLQGFGRPTGYSERQVRRWSSQWDIVGLSDLNSLEELVSTQLRATTPEQSFARVVHGDYRIDNTLLGRDQLLVAAVVDWELSTIGDPVADVAMMCAYRNPEFDSVIGGPTAWTSPRLPSIDRLAEMYERDSDIDLEHWDFHLGLACYKIAIIAAGIAHRHRMSMPGEAPSPAADAVGPYLERAGRHLLGVSSGSQFAVTSSPNPPLTGKEVTS